MLDTTVAGNRSVLGFAGGVEATSGTVMLQNTIVAGNFQGAAPAATPGDINVSLGTLKPSSAYNLIGAAAGGGLVNGVNNNRVGIADPRLGPLQNNGGPTQTMALLPGSPAIDAGSNALVPPGVTTDQRGLPRVVNGRVDIGAYEL
jgi:hypothetical protein